MSTESYLQPCIWQVMHFAWKGFLSAAITFDKDMDYNVYDMYISILIMIGS